MLCTTTYFHITWTLQKNNHMSQCHIIYLILTCQMSSPNSFYFTYVHTYASTVFTNKSVQVILTIRKLAIQNFTCSSLYNRLVLSLQNFKLSSLPAPQHCPGGARDAQLLVQLLCKQTIFPQAPCICSTSFLTLAFTLL